MVIKHEQPLDALMGYLEKVITESSLQSGRTLSRKQCRQLNDFIIWWHHIKERDHEKS